MGSACFRGSQQRDIDQSDSPRRSHRRWAPHANQRYAPPANQQYAPPANQQYALPANQQYAVVQGRVVGSIEKQLSGLGGHPSIQELIRAVSLDGDSSSNAGKLGILRMTSSQAEEDAGECAICYDELHKAEVSVLCDRQNRRVCRHFYHTKCCQLIESCSQIRNCPLCRRDFHHAARVPNPTQDPRGWFAAVDADGSMDLDKTEVVDALGAVFPLDAKALAQNLEALWDNWDKTKSGSITLPEFVDPNQGLLQWVVTNQHRLARKTGLAGGIPDIRTHRTAWFDHWDADGNQELDREEVMRALLKTFRGLDVGATRSIVMALWCDFDTDNGGTVDREEFMRPNIGLLDTILANLVPQAR